MINLLRAGLVALLLLGAIPVAAQDEAGLVAGPRQVDEAQAHPQQPGSHLGPAGDVGTGSS